MRSVLLLGVWNQPCVFLISFLGSGVLKKTGGVICLQSTQVLDGNYPKFLPGTLGKKKNTQLFITDQTCEKSFERYKIRCSRCCTSPFIDSTQNDQTVENVKPNINAKFFKPTHPSQRCQKRTLRRVPHFDTTRTPPLFSMYQTLSNIHSSGNVELFEKNRNLYRYAFFNKTPTFQKTSGSSF